MEHAIIHNDLATEDIKPQELMNQFLELVASYNQKIVPEELVLSSCPACSSKLIKDTFFKLGLQYVSCNDCHTIYLSPRLSQEGIKKYFRESESRAFWLKNIWVKTANVRRTKILDPFLDWVQLFVDSYFPHQSITVAELFPVHWGLCETWKEKQGTKDYFLIEPYFPEKLSPIRLEKNCLSFATEKKFDVVFLPDTLAWLEKPADIFRWVMDHLNPKGFCFLTTIFSSGFDVMTLKGLSNYFVPPERLNLFSFEALNQLVRKFSFEVLECSTPGVLDVQNIYEVFKKDPEVLHPNIKYILHARETVSLLNSFQEFLQVNRLSSQGRMVLQKC